MKNIQLLNNLDQIHLKLKIKEIKLVTMHKVCIQIYAWLPILFLLFSVLNEFDLNYLTIEYFSFNFPFILIFYFTLKEYSRFDYLLVFIAGLVNDTVIGTPLGLSSFSYIFVCIFSVYLRNITIRPNF